MRRLSSWLFFVSLFAALGAKAQTQGVAYGDWQLHLPSRNPLQLADAGSRLYVVDASSFYFYDKASSSTQLLSRRDGLSDVGVQAIAYDSASAQLVVAYRNGNIDLVGRNGAVRNLTDLLRKTSQTAKTVNQVQIYNGLAYLNTSLGVVVLDLARREVRDTYAAIGPGGSTVNAYATVVLHDTIFAATSQGSAAQPHQPRRQPAGLPELDPGNARPQHPHRGVFAGGGLPGPPLRGQHVSGRGCAGRGGRGPPLALGAGQLRRRRPAAWCPPAPACCCCSKTPTCGCSPAAPGQ